MVGYGLRSNTPYNRWSLSHAVRRWICRAAAEEKSWRLPCDGEEGCPGVARARRARVSRMRRRRREDGEADLVPARREDEEERDRGVLLHRLQLARRPRQVPRQGDEGPAARRDDEPEGDAVRRQAHDLRRLQGDRGGLSRMSLTLHFHPPSSFCPQP